MALSVDNSFADVCDALTTLIRYSYGDIDFTTRLDAQARLSSVRDACSTTDLQKLQQHHANDGCDIAVEDDVVAEMERLWYGQDA